MWTDLILSAGPAAEAAAARGMLVLLFALTAVACYFLGSFNGAVIVSKYILHDDIRSHGSGNAGLTNFYRVFGGGLTLVVILSDVVKAILGMLVGIFVLGRALGGADGMALGKYFAALFILLGHMFPFMFGFRGGKGILSGGTIAIMLDWRIAVVVWGMFILLAVATRYVSLGSVAAGASYAVAGIVLRFIDGVCSAPDIFISVLAVLTGGLVIWKHRENIQRLIKGEESQFKLRKKAE